MEQLLTGIAALELLPPVSQLNQAHVFESMDGDGSGSIDRHDRTAELSAYTSLIKMLIKDIDIRQSRTSCASFKGVGALLRGALSA
jgi:hypothetical protein